MIDPISASMNALTARSPAALGLVFCAGVVTSIGPCIAPRYLAIAAIVNGDRRPLVSTGAFVLGLVGAFMTLGFAAGLLGRLWSMSSTIYALLAIGLIVGGCVTLVGAGPHTEHGTGNRCLCGHAADGPQRSLGAIFLLGAASALVISPCCTPIVATVVATSTAIGEPLWGGVLLASFAVGHALPLFFAGNVATIVRRFLPRAFTGQAAAIVGAVLMLALGAYYGVLA